MSSGTPLMALQMSVVLSPSERRAAFREWARKKASPPVPANGEQNADTWAAWLVSNVQVRNNWGFFIT